MKMIEKVAEIIKNGVVSGDSSWNEIARAAIEAMREPTEEMIKASRALPFVQPSITQRYQAMIDKALEE